MLSYLEIGHIIQNDNKIYEEHKDRIKAFVKKNKIDEEYPNMYKYL